MRGRSGFGESGRSEGVDETEAQAFVDDAASLRLSVRLLHEQRKHDDLR